WQEVRLPVCVGFGASATLAKAGNNYAKKHRDTGGVCAIQSDNRDMVLESMAINDVWGIGSRLGAKLNAMGIDTALKLSKQPAKEMRKQFSVNMERTVRELNGEPCLSWDDVRAPKKQIFSTRAFGQKVNEMNSLKQSLVMHAEKVAKKARAQGSLVKAMMAFAHTSPF